MDGWTLGLLVDYIYTAEIQVTEDNVQVKHTHIYTPPPRNTSSEEQCINRCQATTTLFRKNRTTSVFT